VNSLTDEQLFAFIQDGDRRSLEKLFERYYQRLCRFAFQLLGDRETCEEVVSDSFVELWQKREKLEITTSVRAYLFAIVRYQSYAEGKRTGNLVQMEELNEVDSIDLDSPERHYLKGELNDKIEQAIQQLPPQCQLIYRLHKKQGLKYKEVAATLNLSVKTVENHMGRALKLIKEALEAYHNQ
jgi:RNA polymerase sigma-70 factor (ECF subfamily)